MLKHLKDLDANLILREYYQSNADPYYLNLPEVQRIKKLYISGALLDKEAKRQLIDIIPEQKAEDVFTDWTEEQDMLWENRRSNNMKLTEKNVTLVCHDDAANSHKFIKLKKKGDKFSITTGRLDGYGSAGTSVDQGEKPIEDWGKYIKGKKAKGYVEESVIRSMVKGLNLMEARLLVEAKGYKAVSDVKKNFKESIADDKAIQALVHYSFEEEPLDTVGDEPGGTYWVGPNGWIAEVYGSYVLVKDDAGEEIFSGDIESDEDEDKFVSVLSSKEEI